MVNIITKKSIKKIMLRTVIICLMLLFANIAAYAEPGDIASKLRIFTWTANTESDLAGYKIYHEREFLVDIPDPLVVSFNYFVEGLLEGENIFNMTACDTSGNESALSADAVFFYDSISPAIPIGVIVH